MTAQVAILNSLAVALATDSAVTVRTLIEDKITGKQIEREKIFNSVDKLFILSDCLPIGIMINGNAEIMGVPWESVISIYKGQLTGKPFLTVEDQARNFISFLDKENILFDARQQRDNFKGTLASYFDDVILTDIKIKVNSKFKGKIKGTDVRAITNEIIEKHWKIWSSTKQLQHLPKRFHLRIKTHYRKDILEIIERYFRKVNIENRIKIKLIDIACFLMTRDIFPTNISGLVIAGFGKAEKFPSIISYEIEGVILNRLKYKTNLVKGGNNKPITGIFPFAQRDVVDSFIGGIHIDFMESISDFLNSFLKNYAKTLLIKLTLLNQAKNSYY